MKPLVSILIPCYNAAPWLAETLQSALDQTWKNLEVVVVDDGSTDNSLKIARQFDAANIKVISQENQGASAARNTALKAAQGDYIQYLDADDLLSPQKIEKQVKLLLQNPSGMLAVCGTIHFFDGQIPDKGIYEDGLPILVDSDDPLDWLLRLLGADDGYGGMVHPGAWLTPRNVVDITGFWDEQLSLDDDGEYFARIVLNSRGIRRTDTVVSYYRKYKNATSLSGGNSKLHYLSAIRSLDSKAQNILVKTESKRAKSALARSYMDIAIIAYPDYPEITEVALKKVAEMGGTNWLPIMGSWRTEILKKLIGWRATKIFNQYYNRSKKKLTQGLKW